MTMIFNILAYIIITAFIGICLFKEKYINKVIAVYNMKFNKKLTNVIIYPWIYFAVAAVIANIVFLFYKPIPSSLVKYDQISVPFMAMFGIISAVLAHNKKIGCFTYCIYCISALFANTMFSLNSVCVTFLFAMTMVFGLLVSPVRKNKMQITAFLTAACVWLIVNFFIVRTIIPTESMADTIPAGSTVIGNKFIYKFLAPHTGDIIGFLDPVTKRVEYTKRLAVNSGETGDFNKDINGHHYTVEGILKSSLVYVPKKGDAVKIKRVLKAKKIIGLVKGQLICAVDFNTLKEIHKEELYSILNKYKFDNVKAEAIIGNTDYLSLSEPESEYFYTFTLSVNGKETLPIYEFRSSDNIMKKLLKGQEYTLKKDYILALGDNTKNSFDGRYFGFIAKNDVLTNFKYKMSHKAPFIAKLRWKHNL